MMLCELAISLTFESIATVKVDSSITIDREMGCTFGRRECVLGWNFGVDHNYVSSLGVCFLD
jgi:hypothetical protein